MTLKHKAGVGLLGNKCGAAPVRKTLLGNSWESLTLEGSMKEIEINGLTKKQTLENMNYNAADHVSKAEEFKKPVDLAEWMKNFSNNHGVTAP